MRAVVIGCGKIGSALDEGVPPAPVGARTHAAVYARDPRVDLVGLCDTNGNRAATAAAAWRTLAFTDPTQMLQTMRPDLVSICTPPSGRLELVEAALAAGARAIWCEKPLALRLAEAAQIAALVRDAPVAIAVNYFRRWSPLRAWLTAAVEGRQLGSPRVMTITYGKGIRNNASHMLDLAHTIVGLPRPEQYLYRLDDGYPGDTSDETCAALFGIETADGPVPIHLVPTDCRRFTVLEMDIVMSGGRLRVTDLGDRLDMSTTEDDPTFNGYRRLASVERRSGGIGGCFEAALTDLIECVGSGLRQTACTADDAAAIIGCIDGLLGERRTPHSG